MGFNKTSIDWPFKPLYTWNPVVGCKRYCWYCYARKMNTRYGWLKDFSQLQYYPERLVPPHKKVKHVFVGSMSDIEYWEEDWTNQIICYCNSNRNINFYFLSKNPMSYRVFDWPSNCFLGLTMTLTQTEHCQCRMVNSFMEYCRNGSFLSIEPLLGSLSIQHSLLGYFDKIVVGAMTGPGAIRPKQEWIDSIKALNLPNIYWKENIKGYKE